MNLAGPDYAALLIALAIAVTVAATLIRFDDRMRVRRGWIVAAVLTLILAALGGIDLWRRQWTDVRFSTVILAAAITVLGAKGMVHATRRVWPWFRWLLVIATAFAMLFAGLLVGATGVSRMLPF